MRDAILAALMTFVTSAVGLGILYWLAADAQLQAVRSELLQLAKTGAAQVDGDLHKTMNSPEQEGSPDHERLLAPLVRLHRAAHDVIYVYTAIQKPDGNIYWILDTGRHFKVEGNDGPHDPIMTRYKGHDPDLLRAFRDRTAYADEQPFVEPMRTYLSAYAPFLDSEGQFVGLFCVDMVLTDLEARMVKLRWAFAGALLVVFVLSGLSGLVALRIRVFTAALVAKLRAARAQAEANAAAAEAASRAKAAFLAMMSHEIRTPMNGMLGVADLLRAKSPTPEQKKLLDILSGSGELLLRIINDILDFSKIEAEKLELRMRPFELRGLLNELEALLSTQASAKRINLIIDADPQLPAAVNGDRQRLSQVLLNLGNNAVKFTDRGEVRLVIRRIRDAHGGAKIEFTMHDTGIGISPDSLSNLFTPFNQVADLRPQRGGGTGLGLVISQKLVNLMGGVITATSEPKRGSTFQFTVDLPEANMPAPAASTTGPSIRPQGYSVLVAEDNAVNQTIVEAMLRQLGHLVTVVGNGREALAALARDDFDLVLMDCNMPELDGLEAARQLRAGAGGVRNPNVPVIALTANAMDGDRETCLAAGMDDFLSKPVTIAALRDAIERMREQRARPAA